MDYFNALALITNFIVIPGLTYGSQLALGALGVTLIYAVLRFSNFAHGELMSFGAMICILFTWLGQSYGFSFSFLPTALLFLPIAVIFCVLYCIAIEAYSFESVDTNTRSIPANFAAAILKAINGCPANRAIFFPGTPFEPLRAGMIAMAFSIKLNSQEKF